MMALSDGPEHGTEHCSAVVTTGWLMMSRIRLQPYRLYCSVHLNFVKKTFEGRVKEYC
jgi:hypothetical protein